MSSKDSFPESSLDSEEISDSEDDFDELPKNAHNHFAYCTNSEDEQEKYVSGVNFMNVLLESSDNNAYPVYKGESIFSDDWDEAVFGWKEIVPNAKYLPRRKRRKNVELETEKPRGGTLRANSNSNGSEHRQSQQAVWKSNVEPVTYRYIPNNGQYRLHKFCKEEREWYTVRRKNAERVTPSLKARYVQREIKRQMKKDFSRKSVQDESAVDSDTVKRSQSTNSEGCRDKTSSFSPLVKSASDLYVENISTRLDELDKEIKRDSRIRKSHDDQNRPFPFNITKGKLHSKLKDSTGAPRRAQQEVQSVPGSFIVTPVGPQEGLRPLEKITPQQRMKEELMKVPVKNQSEESGGGDTPGSETQLTSAIEVTNFDLERLRILPLAETSRTYIDKIVKSKQENSNILSGSVNRKLGTQFVSSIVVEDSDFRSVNRNGIAESDTAVHSSRTRNMKEPNLPEIAGRRLEVSLTNYRLL